MINPKPDDPVIMTTQSGLEIRYALSATAPSDYTPLRFIESTGKQILDTGIMPSPTSRVFLDFQMTDLAVQQRIFCSGCDDSVVSFNLYVNSGTKFAYSMQDGGRDWRGTSVPVNLNRHVIDINGATNKYYIDNTEYTLKNNVTQTGELSIALFGGNTETGWWRYAKLKMYACKMWDNNVLVRDYIPAKNSSGVAGLYDLVGKKFYSSATTTQFVASQDNIEVKSPLGQGALAGYPYFTLGTYNNKPVRWVIIGRSPTITSLSALNVGVYNFETWLQKTSETNRGLFEQDSPAGKAIAREYQNQRVYDEILERIVLANVVANSEIPNDCLLCLSEIPLIRGVFSSSNSSNYEGSNYQTIHQNLYSSGLGLTALQKEMIVPQTFTNIYYPSNTSTSTNQYFFPLAGRGEKYDMSRYLATQELRVSTYPICLRSGRADLYQTQTQMNAYCLEDGRYTSGIVSNNLHSRPAFVMKLS